MAQAGGSGRQGAIDRLLSRVATIGNEIGVWFLIFIVCLTVADVAGRKWLSAPVPGAAEMTQLSLGVVISLSIAYTTLVGGQVAMTLGVERLPARWRPFFSSAAFALGAGLFGLLGWATAGDGLQWMRMQRTTELLHVPLYPFKMMLSLGAFLTALVLVMLLVRKIREIRAEGQRP